MGFRKITARILIVFALIVLIASGVSNIIDAIDAGMGRGGEFFIAATVVQGLFIILIGRSMHQGLSKNSSRSFKRIALWMLLPLGLIIMTGIGLIPLFGTAVSFLLAVICCFIASFILTKNQT